MYFLQYIPVDLSKHSTKFVKIIFGDAKDTSGNFLYRMKDSDAIGVAGVWLTRCRHSGCQSQS